MNTPDDFFEAARQAMQKANDETARHLAKIRAGRAHTQMLDHLRVNYYGSPTPLSQVAAINTVDARLLHVKPWEKSLIPEIEKAILQSDIGMTPQNNGEIISLQLPRLSEERRREIIKHVKQEIEQGRIRIRNIRKDSNNELKKLPKDQISDDDHKKISDKIQKLTDTFVKTLDELLERKEKEILSV